MVDVKRKLFRTIGILLLLAAGMLLSPQAGHNTPLSGFDVTSAGIRCTKIDVRFTEAVDPASIGPDSLALANENGSLSVTWELKEQGRRLSVRVLRRHFSALFHPLVLTLTPGIRSLSGKSLDRGLVKVFNVLDIENRPSPSIHMGPRTIVVSRNPRIEIASWVWHHFWSRRFVGNFDHDADERDLLPELEKAKGDESRRFSQNTGIDVEEWLRRSSNPQYLKKFRYPVLHAPRIAIDGVQDGQSLKSGSVIAFSATDAGGNLRLLQAWMTHAPFASGSAVTGDGPRWLFVVAVDSWHLFDYRFLRFSVDGTPPSFVWTQPAGDITVTAPELPVSGEVEGAVRVTINDVETPLANHRFQKVLLLQAGANPVRLKAFDAAGNFAEKSFVAVYLHDDQPPVVIVHEPVAGSFLSQAAVTVRGAVVSQSHIVSVLVNGQNAALPTPGTFELVGLPLQEGTNLILVEATNEFGRKGSAEIAVVRDTVFPTVNIQSPQDHASFPTPSVTITGTVEEENLLSLTLGSRIAQVSANAFVFADVPLAPGENRLTVTALDKAGNRTDAALTLYLDTAGPAVVILEPQDQSFLNTRQVTIRGTASDDHLRSVTVNGQAAQVSGESFAFVDFPLNDGENVLTVAAEDEAGNRSQESLTLFVDTVAPAIAVESPGEASCVNTPAITIQGTVDDPNFSRITLNGIAGQVTGNAFTFAGVALAEGENTLVLEAEDKAGNVGQKTLVVTLDTAAPLLTITEPADASLVSSSRVPVKGTVDDAHLLRVTLNGTDGQVTGNAFAFAGVDLAEGENRLTVVAEDQADNRTEKSVTVTRDSTGPKITVSAPPADSFVNATPVTIQGTVDDPHFASITCNAMAGQVTGNAFTFAGVALAEGQNTFTLVAADEAGNQSQSILKITLDTGLPVLTVEYPGPGLTINTPRITVRGKVAEDNLSTVTLAGVTGQVVGDIFYFENVLLQPGANAIHVEARDKAGNAASQEISVVLDTDPPAVAITEPIGGSLLPSAMVTVRGTAADAAGLEVTVNGVPATLSAGTFTASLQLAEGQNTILARARDGAGNVSESTIPVHVDTRAPILSVLTPANGAVVSAPLVEVVGSVEEPNLKFLKINGASVTPANGSFVLPGLSLAEGDNAIRVEAEDTLGRHTETVVAVRRDSSGPHLVSVKPADASVAVFTQTTVEAEFSEAVAPSSLSSDSFFLSLPSNARIAGTLSLQGKIARFTPASPLPDSTRISVSVTAAIRDLAGNGLANPYSGSFTTVDATPPPAPALDAYPETTARPTVTLSGSTEPGARLTASGGATMVTAVAGTDGRFSLAIPLMPGQLNQLLLIATDDAGNAGPAAQAAVYHDATPFAVQDAAFAANAIQLDFTRPMLPTTVTDASVRVVTMSGPVSGTLLVSGSRVTFTPEIDLSNQAFSAEVSVAVTDAEGIALASPFSAMFNAAAGQLTVEGEAYDDLSGLPLEGATVTLVDLAGQPLPEPVPFTVTTPLGAYVLSLPAAPRATVRLSKPGYTDLFRTVTVVSGFGAVAFDSRLTPASPLQSTLLPGGGSMDLPDQKVTLIVPEGAVTAEIGLSVTSVSGQGLVGLLPAGWSPIAGIDLSPAGTPFAQPITLRLAEAVAAPFRSLPLPADLRLALARWDRANLRWVVASAAFPDSGHIDAAIDRSGQYALLIRDTQPAAPAEAVVGQPLPALQAGAIPAALQGASLAFNPAEVFPGERASGRLHLSAPERISSGVPVQARVKETHELLSGQSVPYPSYTLDLVSYNYGMDSTVVDFTLSPSASISISDLKVGSLDAVMVRHTQPALGVIVGVDGGTVTGQGGAEIEIEPQSVDRPVSVAISARSEAELTVPIPAGFRFLGAIEFSCSGIRLQKSATLKLALDTASLPPETQVMLVRLKRVGSDYLHLFSQTGQVETGKVVSHSGSQATLPLPGVTEGGLYLFLQPQSPAGFFQGTVTDKAQPLAGGLVLVSQNGLASASLGTGLYASCAFVGENRLLARNPATHDEGSAIGTIQAAGEVRTLDLSIQPTGPAVLGVNPENDAQDIPVSSTLQVIFSEEIRASSLNAASFRVTSAGKPVLGVLSLSADGRTCTFKPAADLPSGRIDLSLSVAILDMTGNPMASAFASSFTTKDFVPPVADSHKIHLIIPGSDEIVRLAGEEWSVEAAATVTVFNSRTGVNKSVTAGSDGSFSLQINGRMSDELKITVMDLAKNVTVVPTPRFTSADGMTVVMDSRPAEYVTPQGLGMRLEADTFDRPVAVRLEEWNDPASLAPAPLGYTRLKAVRLDTGGVRPKRALKLSMPAPTGLPAGGSYLVGLEVVAMGQKKLMVMDTCSLSGDRLQTNSPPFPGCVVDGAYSYLYAPDALSFMTFGMPDLAFTMISGSFAYLSTIVPSTSFSLPCFVTQTTHLEVYDTLTGEKLWEGDKQAPASAGQAYVYNDNFNTKDKVPPYPVSADHFRFYLFDLSAVHADMGVISAQATDANDDDIPDSGPVTVSGRPESMPVRGQDEAAWKVRLFNFRSPRGTADMISADPVDADATGAFSISVVAELHDRLLLAPEAAEVPLQADWTFTFSEALDPATVDTSKIKLFELADDGSRKETRISVEIPETAAFQSLDNRVYIRPDSMLGAGRRYELRFDAIADRAGNTSSMTFNLRTASPETLANIPMSDVYRSVRRGAYLYVAAGSQGLRILDVSNPANPVLLSTFDAADAVRGVALYEKQPDRLVICGGGTNNFGFVKLIDISNPASPQTVKSQIVSYYVGYDFGEEEIRKLPLGYPRNVEVAGDMAFVSIFGDGGFVIVDLTRMEQGDFNSYPILGIFPVDLMSAIVPIPNLQPDGVTVRYDTVAISVLNVGLRIVDISNPSLFPSFFDSPELRKVKAERCYRAFWSPIEDPRNMYFDGLEAAAGCPMDLDGDDKVDADEKADLLFCSVRGTHRLYVLDVTNPTQPQLIAEIELRDKAGRLSSLVGAIVFDRGSNTLFLTDRTLGLVQIDGRHLVGMQAVDVGLDGQDDRILGITALTGNAQFGLSIDSNLKIAYVGEQGMGIESVRLGRPEVHIVEAAADPSGAFPDAEGLFPVGYGQKYNAFGHPSTFRVVACLPGVLGETVQAEVSGLNSQLFPMVRWAAESETARNTSLKVLLRRQAAASAKTDDKFNYYVSDPILALAKPRVEPGENPLAAPQFLFSGEYVKAGISRDMWEVIRAIPNMSDYIDFNDLLDAVDIKKSLPMDLADADKPNPRNNPSTGSGELSLAGPGLAGGSNSSVYLHSGEFFLAETDLGLPGRGFDFSFDRKYESQSVYSGPLGWGWDFTYNQRLVELPSGDVYYFDGTGRRELFTAKKLPSGSIGGFEPPAGLFAELNRRADGSYVLRHADGFFLTFDPYGRLVAMQDRFSNCMEFSYNLCGQLGSVMDTMGRVYALDYYPLEDPLSGSPVSWRTGRLKSVVDFSGRKVEFDYDDQGNLKEASLAGRKRQYAYSSPSADMALAHNLTSVTDALNRQYIQVGYGDDKVNAITYGTSRTVVNSGASASTVDARGISREYTHNEKGILLSMKAGGFTTAFIPNDNGLFIRVTYPLGNSVDFMYDSANPNPRMRGNLSSVIRTPDGTRGGNSISESYQYQSDYNLLSQSTDGNGITTTYALTQDLLNIARATLAESIFHSYTYDRYGRPLTATDPMGRITAYEYYTETAPTGFTPVANPGRTLDSNGGGYLKRMIADSGGDNISSEYIYGDTGAVQTMTDGTGASTRYTRNVFDLPETVTSGGGAATRTDFFSYDANNNMTSSTSRGITELREYNAVNLPTSLVRQGSGKSQWFRWTYDPAFNVQKITYPLGNYDEFEYDDNNRLLRKRLGNNLSSIEYRRDGNGNVTETIDGASKSWLTRYDGNDRPSESLDPLSRSIKATLDNNGNVTAVAAPLGMSSVMQYTQRNQLQTQTVAGSIRHDYIYDSSDNLTSYTNPNRKAWGFAPTGSGLMHSMTDPIGNSDTYTYDRRGQATKVEEQEQGGRRLERTAVYDSLGNPTETNDSIGRRNQVIYNGQTQRPEGMVDPESGTRSLIYDGLGRLEKETAHVPGGENVVRTHAYDDNGNLISITDGRGNATTYRYDTRDRLTDKIYADNKKETYQYDGADRVTSVLLADNSQVQNVYDDAGRLRERIITASPSLGGATHEYFDYDDLDRLVKARNDFSTVDFVYNAQGRLEKETQRLVSHNLPAVSFDVTYQYDANGNKTRIDYPSGSQLTIRPDDLDRIRDVTTAGFLAEYTYEGRDKVVGKNFANAMRLTVRHDDGRRPESVEFKGQGDRLLIGRDLTHDKKDLKTEETKKDESNRKTTYNYDPVARMVSAEQDLRARFNTFDSADNLTRQAERNKTVTEVKEAEYNSRNQRLIFGTAHLSYDDNGNLKSIQPRATSPNDWTYTYDYANRLVKAVKANGDITEYVYDALGRRARKVFTDGQTHQVIVVTYAYDGDQVVEERDANEALLARYIYGNGIDEPLCIERPNPLTGQLSKYLPMQDTNGNIMGLANLTGLLVEKVRYTESGEAIFEYDHVAPQVDVARIAGGNLRIRFSEPVDQTKATSAIKVLDGANPIAGTVAFEDEDRLAIFTPTSPLPQAVTLTLKITTDLEDTSGNALTDEFNHTFSYQGSDMPIYDRVPPEVERAEYASGVFSIILTEEYDPTSLANSVEIISATQTIGGTVTADGPRKLSFSPSQSLQNDTEYTLKVKTSLKDLAGKSLIEFTKVFIFDNTDRLLFEKPSQKEHGESYVKNTTLFQGREYDPETGLYYFRARYYAPKLSMFIQPDPMGYEDSMNLYQGMGNNPVNFMDPMGMEFTNNDLRTLIKIKNNKGKNAANNWINNNSNFTDADKLALNMQVIFGIRDPDKEEANRYKPNFIGDFIDGVLWDLGGKTYSKIALGVLNNDIGLLSSAAFDIGVSGITGGLAAHYIPIGINKLTIRFPVLKKNISDLASKGINKAQNAYQNGILASNSGYIGNKPTPYPQINRKGIIQWRDIDTGKFARPPLKLPKGENLPIGFRDSSKFSQLTEISINQNGIIDLNNLTDIVRDIPSVKDAGDLIFHLMKKYLSSRR